MAGKGKEPKEAPKEEEKPLIFEDGEDAFFQEVSLEQQKWLMAYCRLEDAKEASRETGTPHMRAMRWWRDDDNFHRALSEARSIIGWGLEGQYIRASKSEKSAVGLQRELLRAHYPQQYDPTYQDPEDGQLEQIGFTEIEVNASTPESDLATEEEDDWDFGEDGGGE